MRRRSLDLEISSVVASGSCSGCGACCLIDPGLEMALDDGGFMRPTRVEPSEVTRSTAVREFRASCPGRTVHSPSPRGARRDPNLGSYLQVWAAWATDGTIRHQGASGGVLTALSTWLVDSDQVSAVVGAAAGPDLRTTQTLTMVSREQVIESAGSRYAPVSNAASPTALRSDVTFVGKPCEASAVRALAGQRGGDAPLVLSFFCAGTPSQEATDGLIETLGVGRDEQLSGMWYRGRGWPGSFTVTTADKTRSCSYDESWGAHLGPTMQWRCKICPDGVGESSDISAADFWEVDANGYPAFVEGEGRSAIVSRTPRGHQAVLRAIEAGVLIAEPIEADDLMRIQPFQRQRRRTLWGRLAGSVLAGRRIPRYQGFALTRLAIRAPRETWRAARGTRARVREQERADSGAVSTTSRFVP